ncbi:coth-domain-containing protein [Anaeromyces robustus]|uniref:Coth-domain-containing protein n=1 Tax=Anaeromyces robustus TaxID=1754192 RepID=A0A1Y1WRB9_9FUNG|nr:coth-domain-containing protein [Anaeromyces robustus]|eukprot:ORX75828.1 coth-domain-containing protein [Anaeromyces robustus]
MKTIIFTILLAFCVGVYSKYLDGLERSFEKIEEKIVDIIIPLSQEEYQNLIQLTQISPNQVQNGNAKNMEDFEAKVNITIRYNGKEEIRPDSKFKTGGMYARSNSKVGYNMKLGEKIFGRKNLRLRPDPNDKSFMREKLSTDILNRAGLPSVQSSYARLFINDEYFGLYTILDSVKPAMIKKVFKLDDETDNMILYQCKYDGMDFSVGSESHCINAVDEETNDMTQLKDFIQKVNSATTIAQFEEFLDVDLFLKSVIVEWLIGSFDHFLILGHNFNLYKRPTDGKWCIILYDFDNTFGYNLNAGSFNVRRNNNQGNNGFGGFGNFGGFGGFGMSNIDYNTLNFQEFNSKVNHKIFQYLIYQDDTKFKALLKDVLVYAFNPTLLGQHISELKTFLAPFVEEDLTPYDGVLPGRINQSGYGSKATYNDFINNTELETYIKNRFEASCQQYGLNAQEIQSLGQTQTPTSYFSISANQKKEAEIKDSLCWSRSIGFVCCDKCNVLYVDEQGKWGIEDEYWCGINPDKCKYEDYQCVKNKNGLKCCSTCEIALTDATGRYGYENGEWCNTPFNC